MDENEGHYSKEEYKMNNDPDYYSEYGDDEEPCDSSYEENRTYKDVRYNSFIYKSNEDLIPHPCSSSYQSQSGVNGYISYSRGCPMSRKEYVSPRSKGVTSQASCSRDRKSVV